MKERMMKTKKVVLTLEDIARLANVSKSTVSRSLNDSPLIKQETKARIQAIAREHHFRLNAPARNLSMRRSNTIGFVLHSCAMESFSTEHLFGIEIMEGIAKALHTRGYDLLIIYVDPHDTGWAQPYLAGGKVDGFVLMGFNRKQQLLKTMSTQEAPFIVWGVPSHNFNCCSVSGDNISGGRLATEHLLRIGKQRIAFLGGPMDEMEIQHRFIGYETALQAAGYSVNPDRLVSGDYSHRSGITAMKRLLEQAPDLDAVFVNSDLMAVGAMEVILNSGKRIPEDIAVVGYDNISIAHFNTLPITTVRQNASLAGKLLAQNLIQYIETGVITNVTIPVDLVIRKSA
jgi:DNA-binding LacI/PurR family transcriptional regulator